MRAIILSGILIVISLGQEAMAQCAMCKTTIVNNVSNGELALAEGLNFGIMYLFVAPYVGIIAIGLVWYFKSKKHGLRSSDSTL